MESLHGSVPRNDKMEYAIRVGQRLCDGAGIDHWVDRRGAEHLIAVVIEERTTPPS